MCSPCMIAQVGMESCLCLSAVHACLMNLPHAPPCTLHASFTCVPCPCSEPDMITHESPLSPIGGWASMCSPCIAMQGCNSGHVGLSMPHWVQFCVELVLYHNHAYSLICPHSLPQPWLHRDLQGALVSSQVIHDHAPYTTHPATKA